MVRKKAGNNPEAVQKASIWYATEDSDISNLREWDFKAELLGEAIMAILASGAALMFGTTQHGSAVSITILDGEVRVRKYAEDSIALDDWSMSIVERAKHLAK